MNPEHNDGSHEVFSNTDDDEIQTVHSEGIRSDVAPPPLPPVRKESNSSSSTSSEMFSLGDISEADERVKKFYGLLPKQQQQQNFEVKTVRMVKRDSKERSRSQDSPIGKQESKYTRESLASLGTHSASLHNS